MRVRVLVEPPHPNLLPPGEKGLLKHSPTVVKSESEKPMMKTGGEAVSKANLTKLAILLVSLVVIMALVACSSTEEEEPAAPAAPAPAAPAAAPTAAGP